MTSEGATRIRHGGTEGSDKQRQRWVADSALWLARPLLYAVQCPIQNCQILALMYAGFFDDSVRIRIGPTLLDPSPSAIPIGHVQAQDLSA